MVLIAAMMLTGCGGSEASPPDDTRPEADDFSSTKRPHGKTSDCSTRSQARFPGAFTDEDNLTVGPLVFIGAGGTPEYVEGSGGNKFQLLVRNHHRVTIEVAQETGEGARLAYGTHTEPSGHQVLTFAACRRDQPSGSSADGSPVTFWSGGVLADSPQCVPLRVWVDEERTPREAAIALGVESCT